MAFMEVICVAYSIATLGILALWVVEMQGEMLFQPAKRSKSLVLLLATASHPASQPPMGPKSTR